MTAPHEADTRAPGSDSPPHTGPAPARTMRQRVYDLIEAGPEGGRAARLFDLFIVTLILLNVTAFVLETVPSIERDFGPWLSAFEVFSVAIFTVEYLARIWTAVEFPFYSRLSPARARLSHVRSPAMIIDLLAIAPFYLGALLPIDLRVLRILRLLRLLKLTRYSPAFATLIQVLQNERRGLLGAGLLLLIAVLFSSSAMYYIEADVQPEAFGSIPLAAWWAVTTLTTVGYGDVTPVTALGRLFAGLNMIIGLCILALPVAIIASGFSQELSKRDFVVNWSMISRVPFLSALEAKEIAALMPLLQAQTLQPHVEVVAGGAPADAMYIIVSGRVDHQHEEAPRTLLSGECFGIDAMLTDSVHPAPFVTRAKTKILKLHRDDFHRLEVANPQLAQRLRQS
jgi:voltage-gated potassium channel